MIALKSENGQSFHDQYVIDIFD